MNSRRWTEEEITKALSLYEGGFPCAEIATMLGRTDSAVRLKLLSLGYSSRRVTVEDEESADCQQPSLPALEEPSPVSAADEEEEHYRLRAERELELGLRRQEERAKVEAAKRMLLEDRIVAEFREHLHTFPPSITILPPSERSVPAPPNKQPLVAVLVVGDVHGGQVVDPRETEGLGSYNPAIMLARLRLLEVEAIRILAGHKIEKLLVLFAGDMIHGHLGHGLEDDLTLPLATQVELMLHSLFPFVVSLAQAVPKLEIYGVAGNHGRWPGMRKMPSDRRWSNFDSILYGALAALLTQSGLENICCDDRISARRTIETGCHRLQLLHGDEVRGGAFCTGGMSREVSNSTLRNVQRGAGPIHYFIMGDKHFTASVPYGTGAFIVNGSFVGVDTFGMNFVPSPPSQTLFFLDPRLGKTETHEIRLDHAVLEELPYDLKPSLVELINQYRQ